MLFEEEIMDKKLLPKRKTDSSVIDDARKSVFFKKNHLIYFKTREGHSFGPYSTLPQAKVARQMFIYILTGEEKDNPNLSPAELKQLFNIENVDNILVPSGIQVA